MFDARFDAGDRDAVGTSHGADLKTILIMKLRDPEAGSRPPGLSSIYQQVNCAPSRGPTGCTYHQIALK